MRDEKLIASLASYVAAVHHAVERGADDRSLTALRECVQRLHGAVMAWCPSGPPEHQEAGGADWALSRDPQDRGMGGPGMPWHDGPPGAFDAAESWAGGILYPLLSVRLPAPQGALAAADLSEIYADCRRALWALGAGPLGDPPTGTFPEAARASVAALLQWHTAANHLASRDLLPLWALLDGPIPADPS